MFSSTNETLPLPTPLAPDTICITPGADDVAIQAQAADGVTLKLRGISGMKPQLGWLAFGQAAGVEVPVAGRFTPVALRLIEQGTETIVESLADAGAAPPPATVTLFTWGEAAPAATATVTVIAG